MEENVFTRRIVSVSKKASIFSAVMLVAMLAFVVFAVVETVIVKDGTVHRVFSDFSSITEPEALGIQRVLSTILSMMMYVCIFWVCGLTFRGIVADKTPFRKSTADRLKILSILIFLAAIVPGVLSSLVYLVLLNGNIDVNKMVMLGVNSLGFVKNLFVSIAFFVLTLIFRYGCQLQNESDETL